MRFIVNFGRDENAGMRLVQFAAAFALRLLKPVRAPARVDPVEASALGLKSCSYAIYLHNIKRKSKENHEKSGAGGVTVSWFSP